MMLQKGEGFGEGEGLVLDTQVMLWMSQKREKMTIRTEPTKVKILSVRLGQKSSSQSFVEGLFWIVIVTIFFPRVEEIANCS